MLKLSELRADLLSQKISHNDYYLAWAEALGLTRMKEIVSQRELGQVNDLGTWDALVPTISRLNRSAYNANKVDKERITLAEGICLAKVVDRNS